MNGTSHIDFILLDPGRPLLTALDGLFCYGKEDPE